jgi:hypothetical protein
MKTGKTKLLQDIEAMKEKLASMEEELNKPEVFKHFPSKGDIYYQYSPGGAIYSLEAPDDKIRPNTYRTLKEAEEDYNKAVALEKIKRRILELQGYWKLDWTNVIAEKYYIQYDHYSRQFKPINWFSMQQDTAIPYTKSKDIAQTIINEMEDELQLIFDIV